MSSDDPAGRVAEQATMLANRLTKRARKLRRWLGAEAITCYRLYDADIPEVPLAVDRYEGHLHIAEYARKRVPPPGWLEAMADAAGAALKIPRVCVHLKHRERQRGATQYDKVHEGGDRFQVTEAGLRFWVNLSDYLDTGLFLDHRNMRAMVRDEAAGAEVLNLFAYTGAFSVYAAAGGARHTTTIDLSNTYLAWARDNLDLNGFGPGAHEVVRADVLTWLGAAPRRRWDLVVVDPPTFSNSKKMVATLDIQRDHEQLLAAVRRVTRPGGVVYFSTNRRGFKPGPRAFHGFADAVEISERTVPQDFRNRRIHRAWRLVAE